MKDYVVTAMNCWIALGILLDLSALALETQRARHNSGASGIPMPVALLVFYVPGILSRNVLLHTGYQPLLWLLAFGVMTHIVLPIAISAIFPGKGGKADERGLSAIEVVFAILIVALLVAICPSFDSAGLKMWSRSVRLSSEGISRNNLANLRSALKSYGLAHDGRHPADLSALTIGGKYPATIPPAKTPNYHPETSAVLLGNKPDDSGGWLYDNVAGRASSGKIWVNCTHTDASGSAWTSY